MIFARRFWFGFAVLVAFFGQKLVAEEKSNAANAGTQPKAAADDNDAAWSEAVAGLQARITLEQTCIFNGTPMIATYLHLRNTLGVNSSLAFRWPAAKMKFRVTDAAGKDLPRPEAMVYDGGGPMPADLVIPYKGTLSFDISASGCGVPGDMVALIDLGPFYSFIIRPEDGVCFLRAEIEIAETKQKDSPTKDWHGKIELPPVAIPLKVEQPDPAKAEQLIHDLGTKMLTGKGAESEKARHALSLIADERVIPWYVKALDTDRYELKFEALDRLSRFKNDEALQAIKKAIGVQPGDFGNTTPQAAEGLAFNIRIGVAQALAQPASRRKTVFANSMESPGSIFATRSCARIGHDEVG